MYTTIDRTPKIQIEVLDQYFNQVGFITDFKFLQIHKELNRPGYYQLILHDEHGYAEDILKLDNILRFYRFDGTNQYIEYEAFHRTRVNSIFSTGTEQYSSFGRGMLDLFNRRIVAWRAGTPNRSTWDQVPVLRVMSDIIAYNLMEEHATVDNGRLADGVFHDVHTNINVGVTPGGELWSGEWAFRNVLQAMKTLSEWSKDNPKPDSNYPNGWFEIDGFVSFNGPPHIDLYARDGGIGRDKSDKIVFSPSLDNTKDLWLSYTRSEEVNRMYGLGSGEASQRQVVISNAVDKQTGIDGSRWNVLESSAAAPRDATGYELTHFTNIQLERNRAEWGATFTPYLYGPWLLGSPGRTDFYNLGDIVSFSYAGQDLKMRINAIDIMIGESGKEQIKLEFTPENQLLKASSYIINPDDTIEVATTDMIVALQSQIDRLQEQIDIANSY